MGIFQNSSASQTPLVRQETLSGAELVNPYSDSSGKGEQVERMFDSIAPAYDFMNTAMTFGLHRRWRNRALKALGIGKDFLPEHTLDIATGTGDVAFKLFEKYRHQHILGIDLSEGMLDVARRKLEQLPAEARNMLSFRKGDSLNLDSESNSIDLITVAYGVRNFENLRQGYREMHRVLRLGGKLCVIELSCPKSPVTRFLYNIYSRHIIPSVGRLVSGDSRAYTYLPESIAAAPQRDEMLAVMRECGFSECSWKSLTFGAVTYYIAVK